MPETINGIGTWYYGKKNLSSRNGFCTQCQQQAVLSSYDTRLWFVVIFIPVIPLGRKHIIDECSMCRRHFVADQDKYEMGKQLSISGARDDFDSNPTVDNALLLHAQQVSFREVQQAQAFREEVLARFPSSADLRAILAVQLEAMNMYEDVWQLYQQAYDLQPDHPEARIGVARFKINENQLDEANELLDFLKEPGAGQLHSLESLDILATCYQRAERHKEALELWGIIIREYPELAQRSELRKAIKKSEKALETFDSMLPPQPFSLKAMFSSSSGQFSSAARWVFFGGLAALVALLVAVGLSEYWRTHRVLTVLNPHIDKLSVQIAIDGGAPLVNPSHIPIAEGKHRITITGAVQDDFEVDLNVGFFARLTNKPVWFLNVGGATAFTISDVTYAVNPQPPVDRFSAGERFVFVPHVDYLFSEPPRELKLDSRTSVIHKFAVQRANIEPAQTLRWIENAEDRQRFASSWLTINRSDAKLIEAVVLSVSGDPAGRAGAIKMLEGGLWTEPLEIQWHRAYTNLLEDAGDGADVVMAQRYDERLKEKPHDASLLYLRGRVASSVAEAQAFYDRSIEADPKLAWPYFGKAFAPASVGDWEATHSYLEKVNELGLKDTSIDRLRHSVLLGLKHGEKLVPEYQQQLKGDDVMTNLATFMLLCDAYASLDDFNSANNAQTQLLNKVPGPYRAQFQTAYGQPLFSIFGRWNEFPFSPNQPTYWDLHAYLATNRVKDVLADPRYAPLLTDEVNMLCVAMALYATGDHDGAIQWRDKACAIYEKGRTEERRMAALLQGKDVPNSEAVNQVLGQPQILATFHAALACFDPERKAEHIERARKFSISRLPPHYLVDTITQKVAP